LFQPGQIAFFQLKDLVSTAPTPAQVSGEILERDGLPILDLDGHGQVDGSLLRFLPAAEDEAYERIAAMEPSRQYRWVEYPIQPESAANVLVGRCPWP